MAYSVQQQQASQYDALNPAGLGNNTFSSGEGFRQNEPLPAPGHTGARGVASPASSSAVGGGDVEMGTISRVQTQENRAMFSAQPKRKKKMNF